MKTKNLFRGTLVTLLYPRFWGSQVGSNMSHFIIRYSYKIFPKYILAAVKTKCYIKNSLNFLQINNKFYSATFFALSRHLDLKMYAPTYLVQNPVWSSIPFKRAGLLVKRRNRLKFSKLTLALRADKVSTKVSVFKYSRK